MVGIVHHLVTAFGDIVAEMEGVEGDARSF
jgi:hypothetical protein